RIRSVAGIDGRLALCFKEDEVFLDARSHREWTIARWEPFGDASIFDMFLAGDRLSLTKVQHRDAVGIRLVVRGADRFNLITALAHVAAGDPFPPSDTLSVSEMQARVDRSIVGFAARSELSSSGPRLQPRVSNCARHVSIPPLPLCAPGSGLSNKCPIY